MGVRLHQCYHKNISIFILIQTTGLFSPLFIWLRCQRHFIRETSSENMVSILHRPWKIKANPRHPSLNCLNPTYIIMFYYSFSYVIFFVDADQVFLKRKWARKHLIFWKVFENYYSKIDMLNFNHYLANFMSSTSNCNHYHLCHF